MKKRFIIFLTVFLFVSLGAFGQSFALIISQNDEVSLKVRDTTSRMEIAIMDAFFDQGFIISNEPIVTSNGDKELYTARLSDAVQSNVAYIVSVELVYRANQNQSGFSPATDVCLNWELMDARFVSDSVKGSVSSQAFAEIFASRDANKAMKNFSNNLVAEITGNLKNLSGGGSQKFLGLQR